MRNVDAMMMSGRGDWETPDELYNELEAEFHFGFDAAASAKNTKCMHYTTDGLSDPWNIGHNTAVFCNPPYGRNLGDWVEKAYAESLKDDIRAVVMLIPARTDTKWFHEYVYKKAEIRFIKGRIRFKGAPHNAPFPSMVVIFRPPEPTNE